MTTNNIGTTSGSTPKKSNEKSPSKIIVEDHPIKILSIEFSKMIHQIYMPIFNELLAAMNEINDSCYVKASTFKV